MKSKSNSKVKRAGVAVDAPVRKIDPKNGLPMWVICGRDTPESNWKPYAAYPTNAQAQVYASGFSREDKVKIVSGLFFPNNALTNSHENLTKK